jgi:hypothetical protein
MLKKKPKKKLLMMKMWKKVCILFLLFLHFRLSRFRFHSLILLYGPFFRIDKKEDKESKVGDVDEEEKKDKKKQNEKQVTKSWNHLNDQPPIGIRRCY